VKGHTFKRCPCGTLRDHLGRRVNCPKKHGSWYYAHELSPGPDGRRRQSKMGGFPTEREARKALNDALSGVHRGTHVQIGRQRVGEYLDQWLSGKGQLRSSTRRSYQEHVELYLRPGLGHLRLADLRDVDIERLYAAMGHLGRETVTPKPPPELPRLLQARKGPAPTRPLSAATIRRVHATLMSALNNAVKRKRISHNPAAYVELAAGRRPKAVVWTEDRVAAWRRTGVRPPVAVWTPHQTGSFLDQATEDRLYPLFHVVAYRGLRRGEAVGLRWEDLDLDAAEARITQQVVQLGWRTETGAPKTDSGVRTVSLDAATVTVLREWRATQTAEREAWGAAWQESGLVFTREDGSPIHPDLATDTFERLYRRADLPPIRLHDLRHTAASLALQAGVPLKVVSEQLGHSSLAITADTYTSVLPAVAQASAEAVAGIVPRAPRDSSGAAPFPFRSHDAQKEADMKIIQTRTGKKTQVKAGGPPGARTLNPRIKSPLLCQLS
jgi:integrase